MEPEKQEVEYKLTEQELDELIRSKLVEDCKIDACFDRYLFGVYSIIEHERTEPRTEQNQLYDTSVPWVRDGNKLVMAKRFVALRKDLIADLKTHVPERSQEWFSGLESTTKQFLVIHDRLIQRNKKFYIRDVDNFHQSMYRVLSETKVHNTTGPQGGSGAATLQETANKQILNDLTSAVEGERASSFFTCGGTIAISEPQARPDDEEPKEPTYAPSESTSISLFWLLSKEKGPQKVTLPPKDGDPSSLEELAKDCAPATFGLGQKDVLDPTYRRAGKLDPDCFSTTFHPADFGILDSVEQILLPNISSLRDNTLNYRRVRAELYKLNVYSGPSGIFRAHVDTPRSANQFGSLVVCLPSSHQGGALVVNHNGKTTTFDWAENSATSIQWGAFYSDCEHEIKTVTDGHRVTLTYNLYVTEPAEAGLLPISILQPSIFPLYGQLKDLLQERSFFTHGGVLGFHCAHYYPHTKKDADFKLPRNLKGSDMALFSIFQSLDVPVKILPVLDCNGNEWDDRHYERQLERYRRDGYMTDRDRDDGRQLPFSLGYTNSFPNSQDCEDIDKRWRVLLSTRHPKGTGLSEDQTVIGDSLHKLVITDWGEEESSEDLAKVVWRHEKVSGITWLTEPQHKEEALIRITYGNEAGIGTEYSTAVIFAIIPPWAERT